MSPELITHLEMHIWAVPPATYGSPGRMPKVLRLSETHVCADAPPTHTHNHGAPGAGTRLDTHTHGHTEIDFLALGMQRGWSPPLGHGLWKPLCWPGQYFSKSPPTYTHTMGSSPWALMKKRGHRDSHPRPQYTQNVQDHPEPDLPQTLRSQRGAVQVRGHEPWTPGHLPFYRMGN